MMRMDSSSIMIKKKRQLVKQWLRGLNEKKGKENACVLANLHIALFWNPDTAHLDIRASVLYLCHSCKGNDDKGDSRGPCKILEETFARPSWLQVGHVLCLLFKCLENPQMAMWLRCVF